MPHPSTPTPSLEPGHILDATLPELHPMYRLSPDEVKVAIELSSQHHDETPEIDVNAWDVMKRAAGDYVRLIENHYVRPVGRGVVGTPITGKLIYYCQAHGWASEEDFCYFPEWSAKLYKPWRRWTRKAKASCSIIQVMLFAPEPFQP